MYGAVTLHARHRQKPTKLSPYREGLGGEVRSQHGQASGWRLEDREHTEPGHGDLPRTGVREGFLEEGGSEGILARSSGVT